MTFKKSSLAKSASQREITRRRLWLPALQLLVTLLCYVVLLFFVYQITERNWRDTEDTVYLARNLQQNARIFLGFYLVGFLYTSGFAFLYGVTGYRYLYKSNTIDFYFSQPVRRSRYFLAVYANGILCFVLVFGLGTLLGLFISGLFGVAMGPLLAEAALAFLSNVVYFAAVYGICCFASLLAGNQLFAILSACFFLGIELAYRATLGMVAQEYLATTAMAGRRFLGTNVLEVITSPIYHQYMLCNEFLRPVEYGYPFFIGDGFWGLFFAANGKNLVIAVVALLLSYLIYGKYLGEYAGRAIVFPWAERGMKFAIGLLAGIWGGMIVEDLLRDGGLMGFSEMLFGTILATLIVCCVMEVAFRQNLRSFFAHPVHIPILCGAALLLLSGFRGDWFGYDRYVPETGEVASAALAIDNEAESQYLWQDGEFSYTTAFSYAEEHMELTDTEAVTALAKIGMATKVANDGRAAAEQMRRGDYVNITSCYYATILYRMKNGRTVYRRIAIPVEGCEEALDAVVSSEEYKYTSFCLDTLDAYRRISRQQGGAEEMYFGIQSLLTSTDGAAAVEKAMDDFLAAYKKDMEHFDLAVGQSEPIVGKVDYNSVPTQREDYYVPNTGFGITLPVYESFTHSIAALKDCGLYEGVRPEPSEVTEAMVVYYPDYVGDYRIADSTMPAEETSWEITDSKELAELVEAGVNDLGQNYNTYHYNNPDLFAAYSVSLTAERDGEEYYYSMLLYSDNVPAFVTEHFKQEGK